MARRFNPAPGWPTPPRDWTPPTGWKPDPSWPPAPAGWQFWIEDGEARTEQRESARPAGGSVGAAGGAAPGWESPEEAGPGFSAWVRDHKLVSGVAAVLIVAALSVWALNRSADRVSSDRGAPAGNGAGWPPAAGQTAAPAPNDAFASESAKLTAAINAALAATGPATGPATSPPQPGSPTETGPATSLPGPGSSSAGVSVEALGRDGTPIFVRWTIDGSLTGKAAKDAARVDAVRILTAVKSTAGYAYSRVVLIGTHPGGGASASQQRVIEATYQKPTLDGVDLTTMDPRKVFEITAGPPFLDPSMRY